MSLLLRPWVRLRRFLGTHRSLVLLWWLLVALAMTAAVLIRMGLKIFNREELLGQDIDQLRLGWIWRQSASSISRPPTASASPVWSWPSRPCEATRRRRPC